MKPENSKERQIAFFKFLALFVVTIVAIIFAVYFDFKSVPKKSKQLSIKEKKLLNNEREFQYEFYGKMKAIDSVILKLDEPGSNPELLDEAIREYIADMRGMIPKDSSVISPKMYSKIRMTYFNYKNAKIEYKSMDDVTKENKELKATYKEKTELVSKLEEDLEQAKSKIRQLESDLYQARISN